MSDSGSNFDESDLLANKQALLNIENTHEMFINNDAIIPKILAVFQTSFDFFETDLNNDENKDDSFDDLLGSLDDLNKQIDALM